jgi:hypothetical protein
LKHHFEVVLLPSPIRLDKNEKELVSLMNVEEQQQLKVEENLRESTQEKGEIEEVVEQTEIPVVEPQQHQQQQIEVGETPVEESYNEPREEGEINEVNTEENPQVNQEVNEEPKVEVKEDEVKVEEVKGETKDEVKVEEEIKVEEVVEKQEEIKEDNEVKQEMKKEIGPIDLMNDNEEETPSQKEARNRDVSFLSNFLNTLSVPELHMGPRDQSTPTTIPENPQISIEINNNEPLREVSESTCASESQPSEKVEPNVLLQTLNVIDVSDSDSSVEKGNEGENNSSPPKKEGRKRSKGRNKSQEKIIPNNNNNIDNNNIPTPTTSSVINTTSNSNANTPSTSTTSTPTNSATTPTKVKKE